MAFDENTYWDERTGKEVKRSRAVCYCPPGRNNCAVCRDRRKPRECTSCGGNGMEHVYKGHGDYAEEDCSMCGGTGKVSR